MDFLIIGGSIGGISIARELCRRYPDVVLYLVDREPEYVINAAWL